MVKAGKYHIMCHGRNAEYETFLFSNILAENSKNKELLIL